MIYFELFQAFFLIGLFCFGGGYAILPFIQQTVLEKGWLTLYEFADIIAVAESTPGPVSINTATFVGYKLAGVYGSLCATGALCLPSFILIIGFIRFLYTDIGKRYLDNVLYGIKPIVIAMIFFAAWSIGQASCIVDNDGLSKNALICVLLAVMSFVISIRFKISPIVIILFAIVIGIVFRFQVY